MSWSSDTKSIGNECALAMHRKLDFAVHMCGLKEGGKTSLRQGILSSYLTHHLLSGLLFKTKALQMCENDP